MKDVVSLDQFRKPKAGKAKVVPATQVQALKTATIEGAPASSVEVSALPEARLTKAAQDFRNRFLAALDALKSQARQEIEQAAQRSDVKTKINVSSVLKHAKSSPLTVYSPLHRETLVPLVEKAAAELDEAMAVKFAAGSIKRRQTIASLERELKEAKANFEAQLSRLASQKLSEHVSQRDGR